MSDAVGFLCIDESAYAPLDIVALTGVMVPSAHYVAIRDAMCRLVRDVQPDPAKVIPATIELHGRALLSEALNDGSRASDSARLHVLEEAVRIVNDYRLRVVRLAYLNRTQIAGSLRGDPKLYALTFSGVINVLGNILEQPLVIPVIDGIPGSQHGMKSPKIDPVLIRAFAGSVRYLHHLRQYASIAASLTVDNAHNLGEPVFADSSQSVLLQLADLVSYLLLQIDREDLESGAGISAYRRATIQRARSIDGTLLASWRGRMEVG